MFILQHFVPFSDKQNVPNWLDETESKFNELKISNQLHFDVISLIIENGAKRRYFDHRKIYNSLMIFIDS